MEDAGAARAHEGPEAEVRLAMAAVMSVAAGLAVVVGRDGEPAWQVMRLSLVVALAAAAVVLVRRRSCWRGLAEIVVGFVGVVIGLGVGAPHLVKGGPVLLTLASLLALVAGLLLLVVGGVAVLRATPPRWRLVVAPVLAIVIVSGLLALSPAVAATNVPRTHLDARTPADLGLEHAEVAFETSDGAELSGWYVPSQTGAAVVLLHGAGSTRSAVLDHAVVLARNGLGVLLFDARGHGQSGGDAMDFGWYGDEDLAAAVSFLETRPDVEGSRIGAVGLSMGGEQALGALGSDERLRAVVAEGATGRVAHDRAWMAKEYGLRGWIQQRLDWLMFGTADLLTAASPPDSLRTSVASSGRPALLITAGDVPDEALAARFIASGAPGTVEIWEVAETGHTGALQTQPVAWEQRVVAFLRAALSVSD